MTPHNCRVHCEEEPRLNSLDHNKICFFIKGTTDVATGWK